MGVTYPLTETKERAYECKWDRDTQPKGQESKQCKEWNSCRTSFRPQDKIHDEEDTKHNPEK